MSIALGFNPTRAARPGRRVAIICLIVAAASAVTSLALGSPLLRAWSPGNDAAWLLPFVGGALPLLAMMVSAAGLFGGKTVDRPAPQIENLIRQLNETLSGQREQIAVLRRTCESATQDAADASVRVARMADTAIDAQTRLADGLTRFEETWERKWDTHVASRDTAPIDGESIVRRIQDAMPELADLVRDRLANFPDPSFDIAASRLNATVTTAMETFRGVVDEATRKIASLNEISQALRRDAVALDLAGREIATAGATVVARAGDTISGVDVALAGLPAAFAGVTAAASEMKGCMAEATLTMRADRASLMAAGEYAEQAASRLETAGDVMETRRQAIDSAADRIAGAIATVIAKVDAAEADRTRLADLTIRLREAADVLNDGTAALTRANRESSGATDATLQALRGAAIEMVGQIRDALAPLPAATAELATQMRADIAANVANAVSGAVSSQIDTAIATLTEAVRVTPAVADGLTNELATRIVPRLDLALNALTEAELRLAERGSTLDKAGERAAETCSAAARTLSAAGDALAARTNDALTERSAQQDDDEAFVSRVTAVLAPFASATETSVRALAEAAEALAVRTDEALARVPQVITAAADTLTARTDEALVRIPAAMAAAAENLTQRTDDALVRVPTAMATAADALAARTEATLARVPHIVNAAADTLVTRAGDVLSRVPEVIDAATGLLAARAEAALARMPDVVSEAADSLGRETDRALSRLPVAIDAAAEALTARVTEAAQTFANTADAAARSLTDAAAGLGDSRNVLDTAARETAVAALSVAQEAEALRATGQIFGDADRTVLAGMLQGVDAATTRLSAVVTRTDDAAQALQGLASATVTLETVASSLAGGMDELEHAARRVALAGDNAVERVAEEAARQQDALSTLPAAITGYIADSVPRGLPEAAERLEALAPKLTQLDQIGQQLQALTERLPSDLAITLHEAIPASLPDIAARLDAIAARLPGDLAECLNEAVPASLPGAADRLAETAPHLDAIAVRLEGLAARLPETIVLPDSFTLAAERLEGLLARTATEAQQTDVMAALASDIGDCVRRMETALGEHDGALATLQATVARTSTAVEAMQAVQTTPETGDGALDATLRYMASIGTEAESLLKQAEAIAEAVMAGRAPSLSSVLAERAPVMLTAVEAAARRLRSAATALAIASDGPAFAAGACAE